MNKVILFKKDDGTCSVVSINADLFIKSSAERELLRSAGCDFEDGDIKSIMQWIVSKSVPEGAEYLIVDKNKLPQDSYFFNAITFDKMGVFIDMEKAKIIHLSKLRQMRERKFIELGFPNRINSEVENAILSDDIKAKLKQLRDMPRKLDLSHVVSPDDLKSIIPEYLL